MQLSLKSKYQKLEKKNRLHQCPVPIIGLTGGVACGKSTVAKILARHGLYIIDADKLIKDVYKMSIVIDKIRSLGESYCLDDNSINFPKLRKWAFNKPENRQFLEDLLYPHLPEAFLVKLKQSPKSKTVVYDVPLLFEKNLHPLVDLRVCVYIPRNLQIERLKKRDQMEQEDIERVLDGQWDIEKKASHSDFVINNSSPLEQLEENVKDFINCYFDENKKI